MMSMINLTAFASLSQSIAIDTNYDYWCNFNANSIQHMGITRKSCIRTNGIEWKNKKAATSISKKERANGGLLHLGFELQGACRFCFCFVHNIKLKHCLQWIFYQDNSSSTDCYIIRGNQKRGMDGGKRTASHPCSYFTQFDHPISSRSLIRSSYKFFWGGLPSSCIKSFNACYIRIKNVNKCKLPLCRSLCNPPNISKLFLTNPHQIPTDSRRNNLTEEYTGNRSSICWFPFNPIALGPPSRLFVGHTWIPLWRWIGLILSSTHDMNFLKSESTSQICRVSKIELFLAFTSSVGLRFQLHYIAGFPIKCTLDTIRNCKGMRLS